jgi:hypothetical protein
LDERIILQSANPSDPCSSPHSLDGPELSPLPCYKKFPRIGSVDHYLYALDSQTGQEIWNFKTVGAVFDTTVGDGVVYFVSGDGYLYAVWAGKPAVGE